MVSKCVQHCLIICTLQGGSLKKTSMSELNWDHIVTEPEHLLELKAYCCEECGYTLFPARGRLPFLLIYFAAEGVALLIL